MTDQPLPAAFNIALNPPDLPDAAPAEQRAAEISDDGTYRYRLTRRWAPGLMLPFIMLNPSTADAELDDPTIRRCRGFARDMGYGGFGVLNLYAYRATKPADMFKAAARGVDIVGPENDARLTGVLEAAWRVDVPVIAAWGAHGTPERVAQVCALPYAEHVLHALGTTNSGAPRHPLYLPAVARPTRWHPPVNGD